MSKLEKAVVMALLITPLIAFASQGGGTGGDSVGGGMHLSSQGGGTGGDSVNPGIYLQSQGGGTGNDDTGSRTDGSSYFFGEHTVRALQRQAARLRCSVSLRCNLIQIDK